MLVYSIFLLVYSVLVTKNKTIFAFALIKKFSNPQHLLNGRLIHYSQKKDVASFIQRP